MRSIATAIEAYAVDTNRAPLAEGELALLGLNTPPPPAPNWPADWWQMCLTTPIAYMTAIPNDPFTFKGALTTTGVFIAPTFRYGAFTHPLIETLSKNNSQRLTRDSGFTWGLFSFGPSRDKSYIGSSGNLVTANPVGILAGKDGCFIYDASNGTVSRGMIIRTNKGELQATQLNLR